MTVPLFRAHVENGRIVADGVAGRPAGAAIIVAELYMGFGDDVVPSASLDPGSPARAAVV
ncbi:MAG TPA: hypothetical protein VGQ33_12090 [Vicinamibacteria bacterium]|nr:hypothetical protein [Vicinamibacteria bacterium]